MALLCNTTPTRLSPLTPEPGPAEEKMLILGHLKPDSQEPEAYA